MRQKLHTPNMSHKILFFILALAYAMPSWSQSVSLTGQIKDAFTRQAIPGVTVTLMRSDSTIIADSLMTMVLDGYTLWIKQDMPRVPQQLIVKVTHPDFDTFYLPYHLKNLGRNRQIDLPVILMKRKVWKELSLNEVVVRPTRIKMVQRGDTIVYDATAFNLPEGSMLDGLVRELPGAELKPDGEIFVNGKKVDYLMLNSREFFRGNNQVMLCNLPYYTVRHVKVYNRTTDLSAFLGREAQNKEYVMDVQLKKVYRQGYLGNIEAGYGTHGRYMGRAFALRFTDNSRITLYGNANNTNDTSSPVDNGQWGGAADLNGERKPNMAGGEAFWETPDRSFRNGLKFMAKDTHTDTESRTMAQSFLADGSTNYSRSQSLSGAKETNVSVFDYWQVTKKWWVSGNISFDYNNRHGDESSSYASSLTDILLSDTLSSRSTQQYRKGHDNELALTANATRKLAWGDEVAFEAKYKHASAEYELFGKNMTWERLQEPSEDYRHEYEKANSKENYYGLKATYTVPFLSGPVVSFTYNPIHRRVSDHDNVLRLDRLTDWSMEANQPLRLLPSMADMMASCVDLNNTYNYKDATTAHVLTLNITQRWSTDKGSKNKLELTFPLTFTHERLEYTRSRIDTTARRDYTIIHPSLYYQSIWNEERYTFHASTSYLTTAANYLQLMPYRYDRNPLTVREGNTGLKKSWTYHAETMVAMRLLTLSQMLSFGASANIHGNQIANGFTFNPNNGVYTYRPENVNGNWDLRGNANYSLTFGKEQCFKFENLASASFIHSVDIASVDGSTQGMLSKVNTSLVNNKASFTFSKKDLRVEASSSITLRHTSSTLNLFEAINATDFNYGMNARYTIPLIKFTVQTDITMYSRRGYGSSEFNTNDLIWNAVLSQSFLKGKLIVYANAIDILHNRRYTQYAVNAQGRTITWQRTIPSYVMLRAQWRFNYNPKSNKK